MSVVVIGLQHTQAPLPLLEAVAVSDADLHKVLERPQRPPEHPRGGRPLHLPAHRGLRGRRPLPRRRRGDLRLPLRSFGHLRSSSSRRTPSSASTTTSPPTSSRWPRASSPWSPERPRSWARSAGPSNGRRRRARAGPVLSACSATPSRRASGCAPRPASSPGTTSFAYAAVTVARGADRSRLRGARVVVVGAGEMGLGVCRALSDIAAGDRRARGGGQPFGGAGPGPGPRRATGARSTCGRRRSSRWLPSSRRRRGPVRRGCRVPRAAGVRLGRRDRSPAGDRPRRPAQRRPGRAALDGITLLDMDVLSASVARALDDRREESVPPAPSWPPRSSVPRRQPPAGRRPVIASLRARLEALRVSELERHRAQLADLNQEEWDQVDAATGRRWPRCSTSPRCS